MYYVAENPGVGRRQSDPSLHVSVHASQYLRAVTDNTGRSVQYRLPERLRMHPAQAITLRASMNIQGTQIHLKIY